MTRRPDGFEPPPPSRDERRLEGKALRRECPRSAHAEAGDPARRDPVALVEASNADRIDFLVPLRHSRMLESPFAFFRGTAILQADDLARGPSSGLIVQACGDCHMMNFGGFATPERNLVFDINDFDETYPAPFEWDLKRLAASIELAARWRDFGGGAGEEAVARMVAGYQSMMDELAESRTLEVWYRRLDLDELMARHADDEDVLKRLRSAQDRAQTRTADHAFARLTRDDGGGPRIVDEPPLIFHYAETEGDVVAAARAFLGSYRESLPEDRRALFDRFSLADVAVKVVGVGSIGTRCLVALFMADADDPLFLQVKEAKPSVLESRAGRRRWKHNGERVVSGQRLMQAASDIFLGWAKGKSGRDAYVRQLRDMKVAPRPETFEPDTLATYGGICGMALARAHAKAGDAPRIAGYVGAGEPLREALATYARSYADIVERDYEAFVRATRSGRLQATDAVEPSLALLV